MPSNYFLLLPVFISLVYYPGEAVDKRCINVPLIKNYDHVKVSGLWYAQEILDDDDGSKKCLLYIFNYHQAKTGGFTTIMRIFNDENMDGKVESFKSHQVKNTSEFLVEWNGNVEAKHGWGVGTDYKSWSTWYLCQPEQTDKGSFFILTREKNPSEDTLEIARNSGRKLGFKTTKPYLKLVDQSQCNY